MKETPYRKRVGNPNRKEIENIIGNNTIAHDVALSNLTYMHLEGKLKPAVTRGKYIGKQGHHAYGCEDAHFWKKSDMHKQPEQIEYDEDPIEEGGWELV